MADRDFHNFAIANAPFAKKCIYNLRTKLWTGPLPKIVIKIAIAIAKL